MSDYGPPPGPPPGRTTTHAVPGSAGTATGSAQQAAILTYAAAGLGVLGFIWGFLDWLSSDSAVGGGSSATGFETLGSATVGLLLAAGLLAGVSTLEKKTITLAPAAVSVAALLVTFGVLVNHGDGIDAGIGLILAFITAILQAVALIAAWLMAHDRMPALGGGSPSAQTNQWQQQWPSEYGPPPGYGAPPGSGPPPDASSGYGPPPGYAPPPAYGPPPQSSPQPSPHQPAPQPHQPAPRSGPEPSDEDEGSRTQVLPRFTSEQSFGPDQNSTQQGIPIFDPQARPDGRSGEQEPPGYGR